MKNLLFVLAVFVGWSLCGYYVGRQDGIKVGYDMGHNTGWTDGYNSCKADSR